MTLQRAVVVSAALAVSGCGGPRQAVNYVGADGDSRVPVDHVVVVPQLSQDYERLGRATTHCKRTHERSTIDDEFLSDVDCSTQRLMLALASAAAAHGGHALVAPSCEARPAGKTTQRISCRSDVARRSAAAGNRAEPAPGPGVSPLMALLLDDPTTTEAFRIRVEYHPRQPPRVRPPRAPAEVRELSHLPPGRLALGDIYTRCDAECSEAGMHASVRVAAASLGASDVVGTRCARRDTQAWQCVGTATLPEVDAAGPSH